MKNLTKAYNQIPVEFRDKHKGWYKGANTFATRLSETYKVDFTKVCGVISALSPACNWRQNKLDAEKLITCYVCRGDYTLLPFSTYGQNVAKAWNILQDYSKETLEYFNTKTGAKTFNFYLNILQPNNPKPVTIDRHAIAIHEGRTGKSGSKSLTPKQYTKVANDYIKVAKKVGLLPNELQAVLWEWHVQNSMSENRLN